MRNPRVGQSVWADGLKGTFTVQRISAFHGTADLELTTGARKIEMHIPFTAIHPVGESYRRAFFRKRGPSRQSDHGRAAEKSGGSLSREIILLT